MKKMVFVMLGLCLSLTVQAAMVAHYEFEGDLTDSQGSYDGTAANGYSASYAACGIANGDYCLDLTAYGAVNGDLGVVLEGTESLLDTAEKMSIAFWYRTDPMSGDARWDAFVSKLDDDTLGIWGMNGWAARLYSDSSNVAFTTRIAEGGYPYTSGYNVRDGQWWHIVTTYESAAQHSPYDGNSHSIIYINGEKVAESVAVDGGAILQSSDVPISIGVSIDKTGYEFFYQEGQYGYMDEVKLYDSVLTAAEVSSLFTSELTIPIVTQQPENQLVDISSTAVFTVAGIGDVNGYAWYKSTDATNDTFGDDTPIGTDSNTLTLTNVQPSNEAYYYCVLEGTGSFDATSNVASLMTKRIIAHWEFENDLSDSVDSHDGSGTVSYGAGVPLLGTNAFLMTDDVDDRANFNFDPELNTENFTFSAWVNLASGNSGVSRGLFSHRNVTVGDYSGILIYIRSNDYWGVMLRALDGSSPTVQGAETVENEWQLLTVTYEKTGTNANGVTGTVSIYTDGALTTQTANVEYRPNASSCAMVIGCTESATQSPPYYGPLDGLVDDARWYDYALSPLEVAQIYVDGEGTPVCVSSLDYDFSGDCVVDFKDFAMFATEWLESAWIYPAN